MDKFGWWYPPIFEEKMMEKDNIRILSPEELIEYVNKERKSIIDEFTIGYTQSENVNDGRKRFSDSLFVGYDKSENDDPGITIARYDGEQYSLIKTLTGKEAKDLYNKLIEKE